VTTESPVGQVTIRYVDEDKFFSLVEKVKGGYLNAPYHNYRHAVDVLGSIVRMMELCYWKKWMRDHDAFSLLIAALGHDLGHPGRTNVFLVETGHELALRYNDRSPLENFHCASLFKFCNEDDTTIFAEVASDVKNFIRTATIGAILHTDNALHFEMVKELQTIYAMSEESCTLQVAAEGGELNAGYALTVLEEHEETFLRFMLHMADVGGPFKPFAVSHRWGMRVIDEFFEQGDEEKLLGLQVGFLNDRETVNRPGSQHGFITFLVSPLAFSAIKVLPMLYPLAKRMASNMKDWKDLWIKEGKPTREDIKKREEDVRLMEEKVAQLLPDPILIRHGSPRESVLFRTHAEERQSPRSPRSLRGVRPDSAREMSR
jgi:hypothetical protein